MMNEKDFLNKTAILITGCISPNHDTPKLVLSDKEERKKQYFASIEYYILNSMVKNIIYCDNSEIAPEMELISLAKKNGVNLEWLSFKGNVQKTVQYGKGYGECEIVSYALEHSELIKKCSYFVKITGRLIIKNLNVLLKLTDGGIQFWPNKTEDNRLYINTRIYMMPIGLYHSCFEDAGSYVNDNQNIYLEHAFGICIKKRNVHYKKFMIVPWVEGISGSTGRIYQPSISGYLKDLIKLWMYK